MSDEPACESCTITSSLAASFGHDVIESVPRGVVVTGPGHYIVLDGTRFIEFSAAGDLLHAFPRQEEDTSGSTTFSTITRLGADSLVVSDNGAGVLRIFGPDRTQVDSVRLPEAVRIRSLSILHWPMRLVFSGYALGRNDLFQAEVRDGFLIMDREFQSPDAPRYVDVPDYRLFRDRSAGLRAVEASSYTLLEYDYNGALIDRVVRDPEWFGKPGGGRPRGRLRSTVRALSVDAHGRLWIYSNRPTANAAPAWRSLEARRAGGTLPIGPEDLYETVVEVLAPDGGALLARGRIAGYVIGVMSDGRAAFHDRRPDGSTGISVREMRLREHR